MSDALGIGGVRWERGSVGLGTLALKKGAALLERMVHAGTVCLRRLADGKRRYEVQFNRFLANRKVTVERLVAGWGEPTSAAAVGRHILAIQDTSEINFRTTRARTRGLGEIGKGVGRGVLLHAMVALDAESQACLGLVAGEIWTRKGRIGVPHSKRPLAQKESRRWVETAAAAKNVLGSAATVTMVADREADLYALWALLPGPDLHVLGRVHYDRSLVGGGTLATIAPQWPLADIRCITLRERRDRPEREARVELRFGPATIARPRDGDPDLPAQVALRAIATHAAVITLQLLQARDGRSAEPVWVALTGDELGTLEALQERYTGNTPLQKNPHPHRSLAWAAWLVARLGGWDGYPSSRPPGPITFKNGIDKLRLSAQGWALRNVCMP